MNPAENTKAVADELVSIARQQGLDLAPFCTDGCFQKDRRWILFWRKVELPYSGGLDAAIGSLHYNMQGVIAELPNKMKESASAFRGMWTEAGTFENIEHALELLKAWLLDRNEIDKLPQRKIRRYGIG